MGCFSFICKNSDKPAHSSSFGGTAVRLFLLKGGKVIEEMKGNYDSYGRVFNKDKESYEWDLDWGEVCDLMFNGNEGDGIALIYEDEYDGVPPTTQSDGDPEQGWGGSDDKWVKEPFHKVYKDGKIVKFE